jgi:hypothetical protein
MRRESIAEWILATVTEPDRAATIVGDLLEQSATRKGARFWLAVLRSAGSLLWSGFASEPRLILGLAFRGWLMLLGLQIFGGGAAFFLIFWLPAQIISVANGIHPGSWASSTSAWLPLVNTAVLLAVEYQAGRWVASRAPGRELSACVGMQVFGAAVLAALALALALAYGNGAWRVDFWSPLTQVPAYLAAVQVRRARMVGA